MERSLKVLEAAERRVEEALTLVASDALNLQVEINGNGMLGGSRHLRELAKICREGLMRTARAASTEIEGYNGGALASYRPAFELILESAKPKLIEVFRNYGGESPAFGRTSPSEQQELNGALTRSIIDLCAEFDLRASRQSPDNSSVSDDWKFAILRHFSKVTKAHKINVIGRSVQPGQLEGELGVKFTEGQRAEVAHSMDDLLRAGFLVPTYSDIADPENWLKLTEAGRDALDRGALNALDAALVVLDSHFPDMRRGAWAAGMSGNPDSVRHAASSGRELLGQVLQAVAPDAEIVAAPGYSLSKEGITRRMRFRHAMKKRPSGMSEGDLEVMLRAEALLEPLFKKLNALTHARGSRTRDVRAYLQSTEMLLEMLLL